MCLVGSRRVAQSQKKRMFKINTCHHCVRIFLVWSQEVSLLQAKQRLHIEFRGDHDSCIGEGHGNPLQCSCLEYPRDGGACWAAVNGGHTESDTTEAT